MPKHSKSLRREIENAREVFENNEKERVAAEGEYALVRGLLDEQIQAVDNAFVERQRLLSDPVALCYVRVHDHPIQMEVSQTRLLAKPTATGLPAHCTEHDAAT